YYQRPYPPPYGYSYPPPYGYSYPGYYGPSGYYGPYGYCPSYVYCGPYYYRPYYYPPPYDYGPFFGFGLGFGVGNHHHHHHHHYRAGCGRCGDGLENAERPGVIVGLVTWNDALSDGRGRSGARYALCFQPAGDGIRAGGRWRIDVDGAEICAVESAENA